MLVGYMQVKNACMIGIWQVILGDKANSAFQQVTPKENNECSSEDKRQKGREERRIRKNKNNESKIKV